MDLKNILIFLQNKALEILIGNLLAILIASLKKYWKNIKKIKWLKILFTILTIVFICFIIITKVFLIKQVTIINIIIIFTACIILMTLIWIYSQKDKLITKYKKNKFYNRNKTLNPFKVGPPVYGKDFFYRQKEIETIYNFLINGDNCSLVTNRRLGKTSILLHISHNSVMTEIGAKYGINPKRDKFIFLDMSTFSNEREFWKRLLNKLNRKIRIDSEVLEKTDFPFENFEADISYLHSKGFRIWILLDEFDTSMDRMREIFFSRLRSLPGKYSIAYVVTTTRRLSEYIKMGKIPFSPFFNIFYEIYMGLFSDYEAKNMLLSLFSLREIHVNKNDINFLLTLAGFHPFFLQMAGDIFFNEYILSEKLENRIELYKKIKTEFDTKAEPHFYHYIEHLTSEEWAALVALANNKKIEHILLEALKQRVLIHKVNHKYFPFSESFQEYVLQKAKEGYSPPQKEIINKTYPYKINSDVKNEVNDIDNMEIKNE